jgi:hypothetical protein
LGEHQLRLFQSALRGDVLECRVGRRERRVRQNRIDFSKQLTLDYLIASLDFKRLQLAGSLSAHIDIQNGLQDAGCQYCAFYIAAFDDGGGIFDVCFTEYPVIDERADASDEQPTHQQQAAPPQRGASL